MDDDTLLEELKQQVATLRDPDGFMNAGLPNYNHLFGRDSCITALQLMEYDPTIAKATLEVLAKFQGKKKRLRIEEYPGKILHEHFPHGWRQILADLLQDTDKLRKLAILLLWRFPYYGSVDAGGWFMILLHHYYKKTNDAEMVRRMWPHILGIDEWLEKHAERPEPGLVGFKKHFIFGLPNQSWKDNLEIKISPPVAMIEVQGYYFYGYNLCAELAREVMNDAAIAERFESRAKRIQNAFNATFGKFDELPMAMNGDLSPVSIVSSNPGQLLFSGILTKEQEKAAVARLFKEDMWTQYGIRTEATTSKSFDANSYHEGSVWPFDNWVIYEGLLKNGYTAEAEKVKTAVFAAEKALNKVPELYAVSLDGKISELNSSCTMQAWSTGALLNMLTVEEPIL